MLSHLTSKDLSVTKILQMINSKLRKKRMEKKITFNNNMLTLEFFKFFIFRLVYRVKIVRSFETFSRGVDDQREVGRRLLDATGGCCKLAVGCSGPYPENLKWHHRTSMNNQLITGGGLAKILS